MLPRPPGGVLWLRYIRSKSAAETLYIIVLQQSVFYMFPCTKSSSTLELVLARLVAGTSEENEILMLNDGYGALS